MSPHTVLNLQQLCFYGHRSGSGNTKLYHLYYDRCFFSHQLMIHQFQLCFWFPPTPSWTLSAATQPHEYLLLLNAPLCSLYVCLPFGDKQIQFLQMFLPSMKWIWKQWEGANSVRSLGRRLNNELQLALLHYYHANIDYRCFPISDVKLLHLSLKFKLA